MLMRREHLICCLILLGMVSGCTVTESRPVAYQPAISAQTDVPEAERLDISIVEFEPGLSSDGTAGTKEFQVPKEVREAEARYMASHLRQTLEKTAQWGPVRVVPAAREGAELTINGRIVESTGEELKLHITATDATRRVWLDKDYTGRADSAAYADSQVLGRDPFQNVYNEIANDLVLQREGKTQKQLVEIERVAELRFARDVSAAAFDGYLGEDKRGDYYVARLPAAGDPMLARVDAVRERDYVFVDTLNEHYTEFAMRMQPPYNEWRRYTYDEIITLRELESAARWRKLVGAMAVVGSVVLDSQTESTVGELGSSAMLVGGIQLFSSGMQLGQQAKMQSETIKELSASFGQDIEPAVVQVAGETRRLEGTAATQFAEWQRLMREIYQAETGFELPSASGPSGSTGQSAEDWPQDQ
ncbi:MAG: hypothetical protein WBO47_15250 [Gammaproteobacteria bacterium]